MNEKLPDELSGADADNNTQTDRLQDNAPGRVVNSETLLGGATQLAIRHNHSIYFLRQTRLGKLILTK